MDCEPDSYDEEDEAAEEDELSPVVVGLTAGSGCDCCGDDEADNFADVTIGWANATLCKPCLSKLSVACSALLASEASSRGG